MLTREIMGALALAILWVTTLLVAGVAFKQATSHLRRLRSLTPLVPGQEGVGLLRGTVQEGHGEESALARYEVSQVGRAGADEGRRRTIHFSDRTFSGAVFGGKVKVANVELDIRAGDGDIWPERGAVLSEANCSDQAQFVRVYEEARKARGHLRSVKVNLKKGDTVWVFGKVRKEGNSFSLGDPAGDSILISAVDPRAFSRGKALFAITFAWVELVIAGGITFLALMPPRFDGWPSKVGGLLGLAFFLSVQPIGTAVRDAVRAPSRAFVRGRWVEPNPERDSTAASRSAAGA
ncbi:MAG: hypothetical protein IPK82_41380 [Polyangiaceae bacterium]|nr:hypothetical protein [Polyangiaceae bacterium]